MMDRVKIYKYGTWSLVALNITVLAFFLFARPRPRPHPPQGSIRAEVIDLLDLDRQQTAQFNAMADDHKNQMKDINGQQKELLAPYFESLVDANESMDKDSLLEAYQQSEREKIEVTYQHFKDIKGLLTPDQLTDFKEFMEKVTEILL